MSDSKCDLLVIGGGVVGASVARDAAMRGFRTVLVEQHDFAFGTSSRSTRLLHGGIRYLQQGRIRMVYEASREKQILGRIAPHLTEPLAFLFPCYRGIGLPRWQLAIGVKLYDLLCHGKNFGPSRVMDAESVLGLVPEMKGDALQGGVRYYDGLTNDARLVLDTLRSAQHHDACVRNYVRFVDSTRDGNEWRCMLQDTESGEQEELRARCIINATGPWADRLPHSRTRLRPTKGVHIVVDRDRIPVPDAVVMIDGKRLLFAIPWGERTYLGTSDTDFDGPLDRPVCTERDAEYILGVVNRWFPDAGLGRDDVRSAWAGLRPLVANWRGSPSDVSRAHKIQMTEPGWWDVTGGKLTTCRLMAEQAVDRVVRFLGESVLPCRTATTDLLETLPTDGVSSMLPPDVTQEAVRHYCHNEWARHVDDVMTRRTCWTYYVNECRATAQQVAEWMADELGWSPAARQAELSAYGAGARVMDNGERRESSTL